MTETDKLPLAVVCLTPQARDAALFLAKSLGAPLHVHESVGIGPNAETFTRMADRLRDLWTDAKGIVVFAPTGAVVRSIAPLLGHKSRDPGVVVVDALARWAIPLVGGHEGGANRLSEKVANLLGGEPIVTTASEAIHDLIAGVGCRRGASASDILAAIEDALASKHLPSDRLRMLASGFPKRHEPGLVEAAERLGVPLLILHDTEIRSRRRARRTAAARHVGLPAIAQPSALAAGRRTTCLVKRFQRGPVLVSIAQELCGWWVLDPDPRSTELPAP
ncbi:MAG: cobalamin biosynthesis protein [Fibrobacterota bacterium]|nr:cobalamin biosynthesis protein [Fibrobacterota bacterium]QQS03445.1 MAG: cobalamin biosynthesis protein [Fibrobacterota bacterium]